MFRTETEHDTSILRFAGSRPGRFSEEWCHVASWIGPIQAGNATKTSAIAVFFGNRIGTFERFRGVHNCLKHAEIELALQSFQLVLRLLGESSES